MNRAERKRLVAGRVSAYMQQHNVDRPNSTRRERREMARVLRGRVLRESPREALEQARRIEEMQRSGRVLATPKLIVPDLQVEVEGMETGAQEKRSPSGKIVLLS